MQVQNGGATALSGLFFCLLIWTGNAMIDIDFSNGDWFHIVEGDHFRLAK